MVNGRAVATSALATRHGIRLDKGTKDEHNDLLPPLIHIEQVHMSAEFDVQTSFALPIESGSDSMARAPGTIRDAILAYLSEMAGREASVGDIKAAISTKLGTVPASSVRSYLNLNVPDLFERTGRGRYRLKKKLKPDSYNIKFISVADG
jgi:hypothetical protein